MTGAFTHADFNAAHRVRVRRIAELAETLLPAARELVALQVASGAWQAWKDQPERLERLAEEIARWDAEKAIATGCVTFPETQAEAA